MGGGGFEVVPGELRNAAAHIFDAVSDDNIDFDQTYFKYSSDFRCSGNRICLTVSLAAFRSKSLTKFFKLYYNYLQDIVFVPLKV